MSEQDELLTPGELDSYFRERGIILSIGCGDKIFELLKMSNEAQLAKVEQEKQRQKLAWYILDEIAVKHSATHTGSGNRPCPICDRAEEAMRLLEKPTHQECRELYEKRGQLSRE